MQSRLLLVLVAILTVDVVLGLMLYLHWRNHHFDADIKAAARRYGVDPALVRAVVWQESRFNSQARGRAGELGLSVRREWLIPNALCGTKGQHSPHDQHHSSPAD